MRRRMSLGLLPLAQGKLSFWIALLMVLEDGKDKMEVIVTPLMFSTSHCSFMCPVNGIYRSYWITCQTPKNLVGILKDVVVIVYMIYYTFQQSYNQVCWSGAI